MAAGQSSGGEPAAKCPLPAGVAPCKAPVPPSLPAWQTVGHVSAGRYLYKRQLINSLIAAYQCQTLLMSKHSTGHNPMSFHIFMTYLLNISFNIILPSKPKFPFCCLPLVFYSVFHFTMWLEWQNTQVTVEKSIAKNETFIHSFLIADIFQMPALIHYCSFFYSTVKNV